MNLEILSILKEAHNKKIKIGVNDNNLTIRSEAPINSDLLQKIKDNKVSLIKYIEKHSFKNRKSILTEITSYDRGSFIHIPLSFSQERLWFLDQLQGSTEYHIPTVLRLEGSLDVRVLEQTLQEIVSRHEVLRTLLLSEEGVGYQEVISGSGWLLESEEISSEELLEGSLVDYLGRPFDLSLDYKLRACLYRLGHDQYVLACVFHHIASDGWSEGILVNEFMELYNSFKSGRSAVLADLPLQYADYAIWQREYLQGSFLEDQLLYWEEKLRGVSTLSLPCDYVRPSVQSNSGSSISFELSGDLRDSLVSLCREQGVTLFMVLLSAFKVLLSRYSGQDDICVGTPIANRTQSELEGMIGFFVNTLALRSDLGGNPSFRELLSQVKQTTLESYDHQLVPFEKVVERVITSRDMSSSPLFQVLFSLQNNEEGKDLDLDGITISNYEFETVTAQFDLTLSAAEIHQGISLSMNYCTALFDSSTIERMLVHYQELLNSIVQDIDQPLGSLKILSNTEQEQLLHAFNDTYVAYPQDKTVVDLFLEQVSKTPKAVAVIFDNEELTYEDLDNKSNQLAHYLRDQGVGPDALVGICLERSLEMLIGIMGILKSGGAYVPVDPSYPKDRIDYILDDGGIGLVLSSSSSSKVVNERTGLSVLSLDSNWDIISGFSSEKPVDVLSADNLAYVIYTSGSTGRPKGVMNAHRGIVNRLLWTQSHYQLTGEDIILQKTSFSFDVSVWELLWPVICGSKLIFAKPEGHKDAGYLKTFIEHNNITTIHFVSSMLKIFLEEIDLGDCGSLQRVLCSGEALQADQISLFKNKFRGVRLDNLYGPTEAAIDVSSWEVPLGDSFSRVLIGKPVSNTSLYVLDSALQLVPIGVAGELCIGGVQVARGYLNNPELTSEKFVSNPFIAGERIYRTGDLARWLPDGNLEFMGRRDDQVKIRGYRIELGEIESALIELSHVRQAVVLAQDDLSGGKRLVGYVVSQGDFDKELVQDELRLRLPDYMVPMLWVSLDAMPLTSNGKIDKKALPEPDGSGFSSREYAAPRNKTEEQLVVIWQELLDIEPIGIHDNFFELGGHSLLATRLVSMIRKELSVELSIREVFIHSSIGALCSHLSVHSEGSLLPAVSLQARASHIPLSFSQERLWFLDQLQGSTEYHIPTVLRLEGSLDVRVLEQTLQEIVSRHEVLRTLLLSEEGVGYQEVISGSGWLLESEEISSEELLEGSLVDYLGRPFDLSLDYKLRACLYRLGHDQYVLACVFHHIASDGWSEGILVNEFMELYNSFKSGRSAVLADLPLQYADYAIWQREYLQGSFLEDQLLYWEEKLRGVSTLSLPCDYVRPSVQSNSGSSISFELSGDLRDSLVSLCREQGVTLFMVLLSVFKVLLSRYSGQDDICVGTPIANRTQSELEGMIGFFVNTLALRSDLGGNPSFRELLSQVKQTTLESYDHQLVPFEKVVERVITSRDMSSSPLFQVLFSLQNNEEGKDLDLDGITISNYEFETVTAQFDLTLSAAEIHQGISLSMNYCTALFDSSTIERMLVHYQELLNSIVQDIDQPLGSLKILSNTEQEQLLHAFNDTYVAYPQDKTVVDLFQQQVDRTPDAVAVVYQGEELSYRELDNKSNQLAHYLLSKYDIQAEEMIGIVLDRSDWLIVSFLAVLKTGAAYIPIDPEYPQERKEVIKKDSGTRIIIDNLFLVKFKENQFKYSKDLIEIAIRHDNLAYVIYTSGSTGKPKGVMVGHKNLVNLSFWHQSRYSVDQKSRGTLFSGIGFDASVWEIYPYLLFGASLYPVSKRERYDLDLLSKFLIENAITHAYIPTSLCMSFIDQEISIPNISFLTGGEALNLHKLTDIIVYNNYGPTESTVVASSYKISNTSLGLIPIGKPIANTQIYILDSALQLVPIGVVGELCVSGEGLARGYLNNPELTSEKFVSNPFIAGERIYRTGDLARWLPDGNLEFMGRRDDQVKIRGYRIELGEIESALIELSHVRQAVVLAQDDLSGGKRLVGYVVSQGDFDKELVQDELRLRLPDYMVPMLWVSLDAMPLTSNGKIDKKALPEPDGSGFSSREYAAPRNKTEEQLVVIWQELLDIEPIGIHDNFFELGGHSLLATRLVSMIRKELSVELSIREVFIHSSIGALCSHLSVHSEGSLLPAVSLQARASHIPLSFSQERLWFLDQLQGSTEYHIPTVLRLEGSLDVRVLEQTLQEIVSRHEVLRTLLLSEEGVGYQEVISGSGWLLESEEISSEELLEGSLVDYLGRPFDLSLDYKLRACLYRLGHDQYVLACVFHHIASDGWSEGILVNEFMELYNSFKSGRSAVLADLPLQYADYAIWQREYLQGSFLEDQLLYWEEKLRGVSTLSLPCDYVRPSVQSNSGSSISFELSGDLRDSLVSLCREQGVTLFMVLLSAFKVLLSRYSGQDDICVGTPIANRTQSELEGMIGFFVNTLALRSDLGGNPSFRELLSQVKQTTLESYDHQLVPFEKVVERVITSRDMSSSPLFQVLFSLQNNEEGKDLDLDGITISNYEFETVTAQFDLTLSAAEIHQGISLSMNYCTALFDSSTIERMLVHYQELLNSIVQDIDQPLGSLKILSNTEQEQLLHAFNDTYVAYPQDKTVVDLFLEQVSKTPKAVAVIFDNEELTYEDLDKKSNQLARFLLNKGVEKNHLIGICIHRSFEMLISILGILKSGAAYVPIDPEYPIDRIGYILEDSGTKFLLSSSSNSLVTFPNKANLDIILLDKDWCSITQESAESIKRIASLDDLAYIIYTSGSTGQPKGVEIINKSLASRLQFYKLYYGMTCDDKVLFYRSFSFDGSLEEYILPFTVGGCCVMASLNFKDDLFHNIIHYIEKYQITKVNMPPLLLQNILDYLSDNDLKKLQTLRHVVSGGDKINTNVVNIFNARLGSRYLISLYNSYGPTENTIDSTIYRFGNDKEYKVIPIGKPIANTQIYILDSALQLVPIGVVGELCVSGEGLARGYLNNPELTSEKFVSNPFIAGERIYRTGDLARWLPDGNLEFMGRRDDQVKIRGYRIELGEIESALIELSHVRQAVVLAQDDLSGGKRLVGYVVSQGDFDKELVQDELRLRLPDYMVPMLWVSLDAMPLTSNGKIDKKALPEPDGSGFSSREYAAPRNKTEEQLVVIWQELLDIEPIGIHDNFFELGGHSLLATRLVSMIRKELSVELSIREVFIHSSIGALCSHLSVHSEGSLLPAVSLQARASHIPLSFSQERLWFLDQLQGSTEYHIPTVLRLEGSLDVRVLEQTLQEIVSRHEVLRTLLLSEEGVGYQEVISGSGWLLESEEISSEELLEGSLVDYLGRPFDLSLDYKLRACLYRLGHDQYVLACVFHHIASDGWSEGILVNEFMELYNSFKSGRSAVLADLPLQYADYAIWQREYLQGSFLEDQLLYWEEKLRGVSTLSLPCDYVRPSVQSNSGSSISFELSGDLRDSLVSLCREQGVTLFMVLLSAFKVLLSRYSGQDDICVGTPIANRTQSELEGMIGFFVNTLALRSDLGGNPSFRELLSQVKQTTLESYDHQLVPFEKVVERVITSRDMSSSPLFQVLFSLQNNEEGKDLDLDGITISNYEFETVTAQFDLTLSAAEIHQGISLSMNYCTALFDSSTIERMLVHYQELLNSIVQDIDQPLGSLKILSNTEQEQLLHAFNDTYVAYPQDKTVVDLFLEQVSKTPKAVAVIFDNEELTYEDLDNKSNQLAHYLRDRGVGPDALVGICLERSLEMLIGIMGILKSGGAYVPVDPSYPKDRIDYILDDGGIGLVLSSSSSSKVVNERTGLSVLSLDSNWDIISGFSSEKPVDVLSADNLAYVMYTSGTTGNPKGVTITHGNIINLCKNCDYIVLNSDTVWLPTGSISFDATTIEFFGTLLNGGQLVLVDTDTLLSTDKLKQLIADNGVNTLWMTASWFHQIAENDISVFECLRYLLVGGDIVMFNYTNKLIEIYPDLQIINGYGPTENTTFSAVYNIDKITHSSIPIGKPIANTQIYILDSALQLVPIGVVGELCVSGEGLARGYLNNPELTSEKFVSNPFIAGERIYRTGDLARWLPDGNLEFMGRRDDQVKIRGYRIELGEIESALIELSHVRQAVVLAQDDLSGGKRLVGYVVSQGDFDKELVQDELRLRLPDYMVPMLWVSLDAMPLTSNGKIDKKALPEPDGSGFSSREYAAPRNKTEEQLVVIWQELLDIEPIGIHDNFFELGGHSLLATRLVSMIRKELSVELSIREVFIHSSIGALCSHLSVHSEGSLLPAVSLQARASHIPLSFSQERLWFLDQLQGSTEYHIPTVLRLEGSLDVRVLEQTLQEIVSRHEVLRTLLLSEEGVGYQEVISGSGWLLESEEISSEELLEGSLVDYLGRPFDLSLDYKLRACLYRLGHDQYVLACVFHHIASDGWSEGILVNEFMELYNSFKSGRSAVLADLPLQYADYAIWQREYLQGSFLEDQLLYWEEKLRGVSTLSLPCDYVRPSVQSNSGSSISFELSGDLRDSLVSLCREQGVTLFMVLLSAFKVLLSRYSGQDDICVGTPIANRTQSELEGMIGFFVNTLALRSDLGGNPSFRELLSQVKQTTLESYDHQLVPFEKVVERVITSRDMSSSPLFQVLFSLQNNEEGKDLDLDGITISNYEFETVTAQFDLTLSAAEIHQGISLSMNYCTALFDSSTIERMLVHYQELLNSIVQDIDQPLGSLKILSNTEQEQLLHAFNDTYVAYPQDKTVVDLFLEQVSKTPKAVAVIFDNEELTYEDLDNKSNQLAHYLKQNYNLKSDDIVGLMLDRSIWSIISILGILKSGTAYLPIDKDYPDERKLFIVNDADIKLLIIDSESLFEVIDYNVPVFSIDIEFETVLKEDLRAFNKSEIISSNLAYVIYTSGSTGRPKGVMISHGSLINYLLYSIDRYGSDDGCYSFPLFSSLSFDLTQTSIYLTLLTGGQLHVYANNDVSTVLKAIALNDGITSIKLTPAHLSLFDDIEVFKLKRFIIGGEQLTYSDLNNLGELDASVRLFNEYGPTEATIGCSVEDVTDYNSLNRISIGKPIANTQIYILDSALQLVPIGVAGELCIGGVQVARGYLNNPELTSEKFVSNPFIAGERIYRTGDLARWLPDGNLEFMGRRDDQVKIRGYRIELGEIESALIELSHVRQAVVLAQDDLSGGKRLVGYVVSQGDFDKELVQDELRLRLPDYMVPMLWVSLDAMPLTSNGKINKKALPEPDGSGFSSREYVAPRNKTEEQLVVIWQELLGIEPIGIHDNFFELGGHSLLVLKLTNTVNEKLGTDFSINSIFQYPTIFEFIGGIEFLDYSKYKLMIALQEKGNSPAIYLAPPASGTANCYIELVKSLGINQPVYAFQCKGLDGQCSVSSSIEEMASEFIIEMQTVDPYGPYRLGGFSFGARVVYEMAFQLEKMGFYVEELLIFDGMVLFEEKPTINQDGRFREFLMELTDTFGEDFNWPELIPEGKSKEEQIQLLGELLENSKYNISKEELKGRLEVDFANENYSYLPKNEIKLDTRIILFKAGNTLIKMDDKIIKYSDLHEVDYGWNQYTNKEVVVHIIPCTHTNILNKEHVEKISYYLK